MPLARSVRNDPQDVLVVVSCGKQCPQGKMTRGTSMALRLRTPEPSAATAGGDLVSALGRFVAAGGRWLALQPVAREVPVYADRARHAATGTLNDAGSWVNTTTSRARQRGADAASTTRTVMINLALVAALLWWVDRLLTKDAD
jgi:hypothetical protein